MQLVETADTRDPALLEFFASAEDPSCLGYHFPAYGRMLNDVLGDEGRWLLAVEGGRAVGCLPFRTRRGPFGVVVNSLPFFGPNGAALAAPGADRERMREALLGGFRELIRRPEVLSAALYTPFLEDSETYERWLAPDAVVAKFTQYLDLEDVAGWPRRRRRDLRRAERAGFVLRRARHEDLPAIVTIHRAGCAAAGIPEKPAGWFHGVLELAASDPGAPVRCVLAELDGKVVAGLVSLRGPATASYAAPFAAAEVQGLQPGPLLVDEAVAQARAAGLRYLNFESSPALGDPVFEYKRQWGAGVAPYAVLCFYPRGREALLAVPEAELRAAYPFYFIMPFGRVSGTLEA